MARPKAIRPVAQESYINILVYGEPGTMKSRLASTSPKGLILANDPDETVSMTGSDCKMWVVRDIADATEAIDYLKHEGHKEFDWAWLDNATLFQEQNMDTIMEDLVAAKPHRSLDAPDKAEYGKNQNQLGLWFRNFKALPMHTGVTAHVMYAEDSEDETVKKVPMFQGGRGSFSQKVAGYQNIIMYVEARITKSGQHQIGYLAGTSTYMAKDRFGALPRKMIDPSIPKIIDLIEEKRGASFTGEKVTKRVAKKTTTTRKRK